MINFLLQHQFWVAVALYWIFSAAISALPEPSRYRARASRPEPKPDGNPGYLWLYRFLHTTAGNLTTAFGNRIPGMKPFILLLLAPLMFSTTACAAHNRIHPGAVKCDPILSFRSSAEKSDWHQQHTYDAFEFYRLTSASISGISFGKLERTR
jgi:hypothetical protein